MHFDDEPNRLQLPISWSLQFLTIQCLSEGNEQDLQDQNPDFCRLIEPAMVGHGQPWH